MSVDSCFGELLAERRNELRRPKPGVPIAAIRQAAAAVMLRATGPQVAAISEHTVTGPTAAPLRVRFYRPFRHGALPAVVFCHGGGFIFGDLDTHDALCRNLACRSGCVLVSVDYRRAPEAHYPAPLEDCGAVIEWLQREADRLQLRPEFALAGDSAGGHIAVGTALGLRPPSRVRHVALLYPMIAPHCSTASMQAYGQSGYLITRDAFRWFWESYLPEGAMARLDPRIDLLQADLRGFPATTLITAECDPLRSENEAFAARLQAAGVPITLRCFGGMIHGFAGMPQITSCALQAIELLSQALHESFVSRGAVS